MFSDLFFRRDPMPASATTEQIQVGARTVPLLMIHNSRARRYLLRLREDGTARVTIPRGGSPAAAREFVARNSRWLEQQFERLQSRPAQMPAWQIGTTILFRGETVRIEAGEAGTISFAGERLKVAAATADLRPVIERHLRQLAVRELPPRLLALAKLHQLAVARVTVRNQKTRWGSCSRRGTISLNWRLIQTPDFVRDYILLHELMHLREMNHSARFWREVESVCPDFSQAERWLKASLKNRSAAMFGQTGGA